MMMQLDTLLLAATGTAELPSTAAASIPAAVATVAAPTAAAALALYVMEALFVAGGAGERRRGSMCVP